MNFFKHFLIFACTATVCFAGCGQKTREKPKETTEFSYSMNALTVAAARSYALATGGKSDAVLPAQYLSDIPQSFNPPKYTHFRAAYLKALRITGITTFIMVGNAREDFFDYCGISPYRIIIAEYLTEEKCVRATWNDTEYNLQFFDSVSTETSEIMFIEGNGGLLTAFKSDLQREYDEEQNIITEVCGFTVGYATGINIAEKNKIDNEFKLNYVVDYSENHSFVRVVAGNAHENDYTIDRASFKQYDTNDYYTVSELALPQWYSETEEKNEV